jgi:pantoate--beta-alanine ligase
MSMDVIEAMAGLRDKLAAERSSARSIALVPTMGNLHEGHLALVRQARGEADVVVTSIFVNPLQFGPGEDFERYPRSFEDDRRKLLACGVDYLFAPQQGELYPDPQTFSVEPDPELAQILEGEFRPGFFRGVATVVLKLFNIVQPHVAVFGKKDFQQLTVVRAMVTQFALPVRVAACETVRAGDGLALSSRNGYLSPEERERAPELYRSLREVARKLTAGERDYGQLETDALTKLREKGWNPDYVAVRNRLDLKSPALARGDLVVLGAAWLGKTRLIDNIEVHV